MIFLVLLTFICAVHCEDRFAVNILHYNDFHARFVETSPGGGVCNPAAAPCVGGFARLTTAVREAKTREPQSLLLNGGDSFQGTIWYNLLRWNVTQDFMNMLPHDAHVLGNHEFDNGIDGVVPYLKYLKDPVVTANIIDTHEPTIQGLYNSSIIIEREGRKIGIIGVIIATTYELASTGHLEFKDEIETVRSESEKLHEQGVNIIIVLSHCGLEIDREIAEKAGPYIDIIVGGHSHTLLYNGDPPESSQFSPQGPYPVVVDQDNRKVLIVQAAAHTMFLGEIKLFFDDSGTLLSWEGHPHYIGNEIEQAPDVLEKIYEYLPIIEELATVEVGSSLVHMSSSCSCAECNLGSLICDAFMDAVMSMATNGSWHHAHFCVINQGGIRADIEPGNITYESILLTTPFENNVEVFQLKGEHIMELLEYSVANTPYPGARMLQVSGMQTKFDGSRPLGQRVINSRVRCIDCDVPKYEPLELDRLYRVVSPDFIANGGGGYTRVINSRVRCIDCDVPKYEQVELDRSYRVVSPDFIANGSGGYTRVINSRVRCIDCDVPKYELVELDRLYRVVSPDFIANGGGGFTMISNNRINTEVVGVDYDLLMSYITKHTPVFIDVSGRVQIENPCMQNF